MNISNTEKINRSGCVVCVCVCVWFGTWIHVVKDTAQSPQVTTDSSFSSLHYLWSTEQRRTCRDTALSWDDTLYLLSSVNSNISIAFQSHSIMERKWAQPNVHSTSTSAWYKCQLKDTWRVKWWPCLVFYSWCSCWCSPGLLLPPPERKPGQRTPPGSLLLLSTGRG